MKPGDDIFWAYYMGFRECAGRLKPAQAAIKALLFIADGRAPIPIRTTVVNPWFEFQGKLYRWLESAEDAGASFVNEAHDVVSLGHTGWYADNFGEDLYKGVVLTIAPVGQFGIHYLAGYEDPFNEGSYLISSSVFTDIDEAAHAADKLNEEALRVYCRELSEAMGAEGNRTAMDPTGIVKTAKAVCARSKISDPATLFDLLCMQLGFDPAVFVAGVTSVAFVVGVQGVRYLDPIWEREHDAFREIL